MRHVDEYRARDRALRLAAEIRRIASHPWTLMEVCGGQTHAIVQHGIDRLLPDGVELIHGPGCPVCVTPAAMIDKAIEIASRPEVVFCSFGDMLRVPGTETSLLGARARRADVRVVYSPLEVMEIARNMPDREVVFFAVGFETTAPTTAMLAWRAKAEGLGNLSLLTSHVLVPPGVEAILAAPDNRVQGLIAAGHVCTVMGYRAYEPIAARHGVPIVVTGFEPVDILQGLLLAIRQLEAGEARVENQYARSVRADGNAAAQAIMDEVFEVSTRDWRGMGLIPEGALRLAEAYRGFDAEARFGEAGHAPDNDGRCMSGLVLRGALKPPDCPSFGALCRPEHPLGATMVSSEGACAAYFRYRRWPQDAGRPT